MYNEYTAVICTPDKGVSINQFAEELIQRRKKYKGVLIGVFNDIALYVHSVDTVRDIIYQYNIKYNR